MVFEFLIVLIFSLVLGNGLLFFTGSSGNSGSSAEPEVLSLKEEIQGNSFEEASNNVPGNVFVDQVYEVQASLRNLDEKVKLAHERITEMEETLNSINSVLVSQPKTGVNFDEKLDRLESFRRNTKIEIEAIKKLLVQLKEFRNQKKGKNAKALKKKEEELNNRIHNLVFNVKKKSN